MADIATLTEMLELFPEGTRQRAMLIDAIAEMRLLATLKADCASALQAALEDLARVKRELLITLDLNDRMAAVIERDCTEDWDRIAAKVTIENLQQERDKLITALIQAKDVLEFVASSTFWVCDEAWETTQPDEDDEREWCDYSTWAASVLTQLKDASAILAAHDRQVAAGVLREAMTESRDPGDWALMSSRAAEYEAGTREVPTL